MGRMSGPAFVVLVLVLVTAPAVLLLLVVPKREPWKVVHIAAWTWIGVLGFSGSIIC
jgi:uncharacterized membrane protein YgdD (TMEM256/DUF423 family)